MNEALTANKTVHTDMREHPVISASAAPSDHVEPAEPLPVLDRQVQHRVDRLARDASTLQGQLDGLLAREQQLTLSVAAAKGRLTVKPELDQALETLQNWAHERSVGAFERMLSAIAYDVQPGTRTEIKLDLGTERNMPALDISAFVEGEKEEITSGALSNIVGTGLRFITLARSGRSKFIVLDEPDCFTEGEAVQNFFSVVEQLSRDAGIQVLLITHHDVSAFEDRFRIYKVEEVNSNDKWPRSVVELFSEGPMAASALQERHFSFIEADNFERFTHGQIELSPGVTVLNGSNGKGKSAWARMLRGALLGESSDNNVRHGKPSCSVSLGFSDGRVLSHTRRIKGAPKGEFVLHTPDSYEHARANPTNWKKVEFAPRPLHHSETARLPEWVQAETGVGAVDGINVALWNQLTPVFMLDQPPAKRASLLSIGRESGHLFAMNEAYKDDLTKDKRAEKEGEMEIGAIRIMTGALAPIGPLVPAIEAAREYLQELMTGAARLKDDTVFLTALENQVTELRAMESWAAAVGTPAQAPEVERTEGIVAWLERVQLAQDAMALRTELHTPELPDLLSVDAGNALWKELTKAAGDASLTGLIPTAPLAPEFEETVAGMELVGRIEQAQRDGRLPKLEQVDPPVIEPVTEGLRLVEEMRKAQNDSALPRYIAPDAPALESTREIESMIEEFGRAHALINSCRAQSAILAQESAAIDRSIERATEVLGAQWSLPSERISRLAEQVAQTTSGPAGAQRVVCQLDVLERQLGDVAREGYAFGLTEGIERTSSVRVKPVEGALPDQRVASSAGLNA